MLLSCVSSISDNQIVGSMAEKRRRGPSPATLPGYRAGIAPPNKGKKWPAEVLTRDEVRSLLESLGESVTGVRNTAIVMLMYRSGLKIGQVIALERRHYEPGSRTLTVPGVRGSAERTVTLDPETQAVLDRWMEIRRSAGVRVTAPLFCTVAASGIKGNRLQRAYFRGMLRDRAREAGIDRRTTCEGLRRSGIEHRASLHGRAGALIAEHVDEDGLQSRHPRAWEKLESALELFRATPVRHTTRIGHDCREAMLTFVDDILAEQNIVVAGAAGTVTKLRHLVSTTGPTSQAIAAHLKSLISYWGTTTDLANRQEHAGTREGDQLGPDDSRRVIAHTMLVMSEIDRSLHR
jgi:hypothetical protein